jgi:hypothetical protein
LLAPLICGPMMEIPNIKAGTQNEGCPVRQDKALA